MSMHLDTHVVLWLHDGQTKRIPSPVRRFMRSRRPLVSPIVRLELTLLYELGKLRTPAAPILDALRVAADLGLAETPLERVIAVATELSWTRDPFDRLIAAHAQSDDLPLITADERMLKHCTTARWA